MHAMLAQTMVDICRQRLAQGDCTTLAAPSREQLEDALIEIAQQRDRLDTMINTPEINDFAKAVVLEAAHQRERWAAEHDAGKADPDWFWLIGYLAGKALHNPPKEGSTEREIKLHRIITVAAAACNWHAAVAGTDTRMRPGIAEPAGV